MKGDSKEMLITDRTWLGRQAWFRERIVATCGVRLRLKIRSDAYAFQSVANAEVWRDNEGAWSHVHTIAGEQMKTIASYVNRDVKPSAFDEDIAELRRVALAILGVA